MLPLHQLDWDDLKYFCALAQQGSLTAAAEMLMVNPSTVSRRIVALEAVLGVSLFHRLASGYQLTDLGQQVLTYVEPMAGQLRSMQQVLHQANQQMQGVITLTAPDNFAYGFLPQHVAECQRRYPQLVIKLIASNSDYDFAQQEVDLAVRSTPAPPEDVVGYPLFDLPWGAYAAPAYLESYGEPSTWTQLKDHKVIGATSELRHLPAFAWLAQQSQLTPVAQCNDLMAMSALAVQGMGVALLPDDQSKPELKRLFTFEPGRTSHIWLLVHTQLRSCRRFKVFKDFLLAALAADPMLKPYLSQAYLERSARQDNRVSQ